jgi:hypothetical protein
MFLKIACISASIIPESRQSFPKLSDVSPLAATLSPFIEYRDLIFVSLEITGRNNYHKKISAILDSESSMCYLRSDVMGLSVSNKSSGDKFKMNIGTAVDYECLLVNDSYKYEAIIGINSFSKPGFFPYITLIPEKFPGSLPEYTGKGIMTTEGVALYQCEDFSKGSDFFPRDQSFIDLKRIISKKLVRISGKYNKHAFITFDLSLAQTEYSSGFGKFEYLDIMESQGVIPRLHRRNLRCLSSSSDVSVGLHLKIGVDILRNLIVSFNFIEGSVFICNPSSYSEKVVKYDEEGEPQEERERLNGFEVAVKREEGVLNGDIVKLLITYELGVTIRMKRSEKYLAIILDTGSNLTSIPEIYTSSSESGFSSFACAYISGNTCLGTKTALTLTFPTRQELDNKIKPKKSTVINGINKDPSTPHGIIGLQYTETMDSLPYIWNVEWMVFIPEVVKRIEQDRNQRIYFPEGYGMGRLELRNDFNAAELCERGEEAVLVTLSADRSTWAVVNDLTIVYLTGGEEGVGEAGEEKEYTFDRIIIDTGSSISILADLSKRESINKSPWIKIKSKSGGESSIIVLEKEEKFPYFMKYAENINIIGLNLLRRLVAGFRTNKEPIAQAAHQSGSSGEVVRKKKKKGKHDKSNSNHSGEVKLCIPKTYKPALREIKVEINQSELDKISVNISEYGRDGEYACQGIPGFNIVKEVLRNSWTVNEGRVSIDWDLVKRDVKRWVPWDDCFEFYWSRFKACETIGSRIAYESVLENSVIINERAADDRAAVEIESHKG